MGTSHEETFRLLSQLSAQELAWHIHHLVHINHARNKRLHSNKMSLLNPIRLGALVEKKLNCMINSIKINPRGIVANAVHMWSN